MGVLSPVLLRAEKASVPVWVFGIVVTAQTA